jgi:hypothetical protein
VCYERIKSVHVNLETNFSNKTLLLLSDEIVFPVYYVFCEMRYTPFLNGFQEIILISYRFLGAIFTEFTVCFLK